MENLIGQKREIEDLNTLSPGTSEVVRLLTPEQLLNLKQSEIRLVNSKVPWTEKPVFLTDLSISNKGIDEDKVYINNELFRNNIRRGNTIITSSSSGGANNAQMGRRGLKKFFDLNFDYLEYNLDGIKVIPSSGLTSSYMHETLIDIIFGAAKNHFRESPEGSMSIFQTNKVNGENAQISYVAQYSAWLICSKNVSILVRNVSDINCYQGFGDPSKSRFKFSCLIAEQWFLILQKIIDKSVGLLEQLKIFLSEYTLVGEYCGNIEYQHLVRYENTDIIFYSIVPNNGDMTCLPLEHAYRILDEFGLRCVKFVKFGPFTDWVAFNKCLKELFINVANSDIDEGEEGSVIYFVYNNSKLNKEEVCGMAKLKTLEYRIFRKLREKLKKYLGTKQGSRNRKSLLDLFTKECVELCKDSTLPKPFEYYLAVANKALDFVDDNANDAAALALVRAEYISFISICLKCLEEGVKIDHHLLNREKINELLKRPWSSYNTNLIIQNGAKSMVSIGSLIASKGAGLCQKCFVILPIGIPGSGKSYIYELFRAIIDSHIATLSYVSSDLIRQELVVGMMKKNPKLTENECFLKTSKQGRIEVDMKIGQLIRSTVNLATKYHIIFVDKNHVPNNIQKTISLIQDNNSALDCKQGQVNIKIIALVPQSAGCFSLCGTKTHTYPFSMTFFLSCLKRVKSRTSHPNLNGITEGVTNILIMFFNMFKDFDLSEQSLVSIGFHDVIYFPSCYEDILSDLSLPQSLVDAFSKVLQATVPGQQCQEVKYVKEFEEVLAEAADFKIVNPDQNQFLADLRSNINSKIILEEEEKILEGALEGALKGSLKGSLEVEEEEKASEGTLEGVVKKHQNLIKNQCGYQPNKLPLYLCLLAVKDLTKELMHTLNIVIEQLKTRFPKDFSEKECALQNYSFPDNHHLTTLFIGGNKNKTKLDCYKNFEEKIEFWFEVSHIVFVPGYIITGVVFINRNLIDVDNEFPHMTLMTQKFQPKNSNDVLEALFGDSGPLKNEYKDELIGLEGGPLKFMLGFGVGKGKGRLHLPVYITKLMSPLIVEAITKAYQIEIFKFIII